MKTLKKNQEVVKGLSAWDVTCRKYNRLREENSQLRKVLDRNDRELKKLRKEMWHRGKGSETERSFTTRSFVVTMQKVEILKPPAKDEFLLKVPNAESYLVKSYRDNFDAIPKGEKE